MGEFPASPTRNQARASRREAPPVLRPPAARPDEAKFGARDRRRRAPRGGRGAHLHGVGGERGQPLLLQRQAPPAPRPLRWCAPTTNTAVTALCAPRGQRRPPRDELGFHHHAPERHRRARELDAVRPRPEAAVRALVTDAYRFQFGDDRSSQRAHQRLRALVLRAFQTISRPARQRRNTRNPPAVRLAQR